MAGESHESDSRHGTPFGVSQADASFPIRGNANSIHVRYPPSAECPVVPSGHTAAAEGPVPSTAGAHTCGRK
ncbi:hypothetical protein E4U53_005286 [Claviceps sorghi]|nr:hypothetical protein E4U53_005286 [Claviceps sorghi]